MKGRVCVPNIDDLRKAVMEEPIVRHILCNPIVPKCIEPSKKLLVVRYEERHSRICVQVSYVPIGEGRTSETYRHSSAFAYIGMEVRTHHHGLRCRFASYLN